MSGKQVLLDTNAIGIYLNVREFDNRFQIHLNQIIISIISKLKFLTNPNLSLKNKFIFESSLDTIEIYPISLLYHSLENNTITIRKNYNLKLPNAIIANTAIVNCGTLLSGDDVFSKIHNLKFILATP